MRAREREIEKKRTKQFGFRLIWSFGRCDGGKYVYGIQYLLSKERKLQTVFWHCNNPIHLKACCCCCCSFENDDAIGQCEYYDKEECCINYPKLAWNNSSSSRAATPSLNKVHGRNVNLLICIIKARLLLLFLLPFFAHSFCCVGNEVWIIWNKSGKVAKTLFQSVFSVLFCFCSRKEAHLRETREKKKKKEMKNVVR